MGIYVCTYQCPMIFRFLFFPILLMTRVERRGRCRKHYVKEKEVGKHDPEYLWQSTASKEERQGRASFLKSIRLAIYSKPGARFSTSTEATNGS